MELKIHHFLFLGYENAFDEVRSLWLFRMLHEINIPNPLLTAIIKLYDNNEIKIKVDVTLAQPIKISKGVRQGCALLPTLFNICIHINQIIAEWKDEEIRHQNFKKQRHQDNFVHRQPSSSGGFRRCTTNFYT